MALAETIYGPSKVVILNDYFERRLGNGLTVHPTDKLSRSLIVDKTVDIYT